MVKETKELVIDGEVLNQKGRNSSPSPTSRRKKEYGNPPKPLLSAGTVESLDAFIGEARKRRKGPPVRIEATGAEQIGTWLNAIAPILLIIGHRGDVH